LKCEESKQDIQEDESNKDTYVQRLKYLIKELDQEQSDIIEKKINQMILEDEIIQVESL